MNGTIAKALLEDAWRQVVDNRVFRLLVIVIFVPIALTFVVGFQPQGIEILWGWKEISYEDLARSMGASMGGAADLRGASIQAFQAVMVGFFGGMVGVTLCIAATAFFVPRMMEKGAADTLFSKPVSRFVLLISRYVSGMLFVSTLAIVLVVGMYLGFRIVSGYDDPGFLWGALTLIYLYGILYAFTIAVATATRSSTAAILLSLVIFMFSGCIHRGWMAKEYGGEVEIASKLSQQAEAETPKSEAELRRAQADDRTPTVRVLVRLLDAAHYALPKTTEASILTEELKRDLARREPHFADAEGGLRIQDPPEGFVLAAPSSEAGAAGPLAAWTSSAAEHPERIELARRGRETDGGRRLTANRLASDVEEELAGRAVVVAPPTRSDHGVANRVATILEWEEERDGRRIHRERVLFPTAAWIYELDLELDPAAHTPEDRASWRNEFLDEWSLDAEGLLAPDEWFQEAYSWGAPLRYNLFFSIGSSLAFALAMLALAGLKLSRVDF